MKRAWFASNQVWECGETYIVNIIEMQMCAGCNCLGIQHAAVSTETKNAAPISPIQRPSSGPASPSGFLGFFIFLLWRFVIRFAGAKVTRVVTVIRKVGASLFVTFDTILSEAVVQPKIRHCSVIRTLDLVNIDRRVPELFNKERAISGAATKNNFSLPIA